MIYLDDVDCWLQQPTTTDTIYLLKMAFDDLQWCMQQVCSFYAMLGFIGLIVSNAAALKEPLSPLQLVILSWQAF